MFPPDWNDHDGPPLGLRFSDQSRVLEFLEHSVCWSPTRWTRGCDILLGGEDDPPFYDHLAEIRVPVLEDAAAVHEVGHCDLLLADSAPRPQRRIASLPVW